ncbi:MAG: 3-methyl-2-oxobutanoate dehydrogenase subunit VorB [Planctomycetota bacterium]
MERERVFWAGNEVAAEAALRAGAHFYAGYPITPQNDFGAYMARECPKRGRVFLQAESELAAVNMVFGASAAGARAMTSSSSPGISLKQEGISYMAGCELPGVIVNVMRGGPGLGNISGSQGDYFQSTRGGGHGDYRTIVLAPASLQEIADLTVLAFDLAESYRTPVLVIYDGYLGQLVENVTLPEPREPPSLEKPWALSGNAGRKSRVVRSLYMEEGGLERHNDALQRKYAAIRAKECRAEAEGSEDAEILFAAFGLAARQCMEARDLLRAEGVRAGLFRPVTLWPFPEEALRRAAAGARAVLVVEMNHGQMLEDVRLALGGEKPVRFLGRAGGGVPAVSAVLAAAMSALKAKEVA